MNLNLNNLCVNAYRVEITLFLSLLSSLPFPLSSSFSDSKLPLQLYSDIFATLSSPLTPKPRAPPPRCPCFSWCPCIFYLSFPSSFLIPLPAPLPLHPSLFAFFSMPLVLYLVSLHFSLPPLPLSISFSGRRSAAWMSTTLPSGPSRSAT